jgi:hypothetical protein
MNKAFILDLAERTGATAAEAGLAYAIAALGNLSAWWVPVLIPVLAAAKGGVARYVGQPETAALLPASRPAAVADDPYGG